MNDERTNTAWPTHEIVLGHRLTREQLLDLFGKSSSEWTGIHGKRHQITGVWSGESSVVHKGGAEPMDLEIFWIDLGAYSFRNDAVRVVARLHLRNGQTFAGDGTLFLSGRGNFTVRGELVTPADYERFSEVFGS